MSTGLLLRETRISLSVWLLLVMNTFGLSNGYEINGNNNINHEINNYLHGKCGIELNDNNNECLFNESKGIIKNGDNVRINMKLLFNDNNNSNNNKGNIKLIFASIKRAFHETNEYCIDGVYDYVLDKQIDNNNINDVLGEHKFVELKIEIYDENIVRNITFIKYFMNEFKGQIFDIDNNNNINNEINELNSQNEKYLMIIIIKAHSKWIFNDDINNNNINK